MPRRRSRPGVPVAGRETRVDRLRALRRHGSRVGVPVPEEGVIELYTSHWRSPLLAKADAQMVSISRGQPRWSLPFKYRRLGELAPGDEAWRREDTGEFERAYLDQLERLGASRVLSDLESIGGGRPVVCLCWEKLADPDEYCHRLTLGRFLEEKAGIVDPKLKPGDVPEREDVPEMRLF